MHVRVKPLLFSMGLFLVGFTGSVPSVRAQAPAGPLPATQPQPSFLPAVSPQEQQQARSSIAGAWTLNRDESDNPRKKMQEARGNRGGRAGGGGGMGGGMGHGGYGRYGGRRGSENDENRERMQELFMPAASLTLAKKDAEVDLTDDQGRTRVFYTDGRKLKKPNSKDDSYGEIAAHWDGPSLVTDEKNPRGGKMSHTFELSSDGTQLYETLHLTVGRNNTPLVIRYVYDAAAGPTP